MSLASPPALYNELIIHCMVNCACAWRCTYVYMWIAWLFLNLPTGQYILNTLSVQQRIQFLNAEKRDIFIVYPHTWIGSQTRIKAGDFPRPSQGVIPWPLAYISTQKYHFFWRRAAPKHIHEGQKVCVSVYVCFSVCSVMLCILERIKYVLVEG